MDPKVSILAALIAGLIVVAVGLTILARIPETLTPTTTEVER